MCKYCIGVASPDHKILTPLLPLTFWLLFSLTWIVIWDQPFPQRVPHGQLLRLWRHVHTSLTCLFIYRPCTSESPSLRCLFVLLLRDYSTHQHLILVFVFILEYKSNYIYNYLTISLLLLYPYICPIICQYIKNRDRWLSRIFVVMRSSLCV